MTNPTRRTLLAAATGAALPAWAQGTVPSPQQPASPWPTRAVKLLVGFPAGSGPDLMARLLTEPLGKVLGQSVVVENRPGASGNLAADQLAKATDGHTIGLLSVVNLTTAKMLYDKLPYDPSDFQPLTMVGTSPLILVASTQAASGTASEFLARARNEGDTWNYGSPGNGTVGHIGMELVKMRAQLRAVHVPFPGVPQILTAMIGGQIQMALMPLGQATPHIRSGRIKAIGSSSASRSPLAADIATLREVGVAGVDLDVWNAIAVPKAFPKSHADRLLREVQAIIRSPDIRQQLFNQGWQAMGTSPEALANTIRATAATLGRVIQAGNIRLG
jgi:tripartite-type tricarboxylate transporter receptor subunit TctC